jgi:hypothetical protein
VVSTLNDVGAWPALPLAEWQDTYTTLHRWMQIVGKTRLQFAPMQNHWWNCTLYLTTRGLGTSPMPDGARTFEVDVDFIDHSLVVTTSDGAIRTIPLKPRSVADFFAEYLETLRSIGIRPRIWPVPQELDDNLRFDEDRIHTSYDPDASHRFWRALADIDRVLKTYRAKFLGKSSPSHVWWGSFDIACTRFSGNRAPPHPGGVPNCADYVMTEAYSHECISVGWWPGSAGRMDEPGFYAYAYPEPTGYAVAAIKPAGAYYHPQLRDWVLPYDAVRNAPDPDAAALEFFESTYSAAADLGHWDRTALERPKQRFSFNT